MHCCIASFKRKPETAETKRSAGSAYYLKVTDIGKPCLYAPGPHGVFGSGIHHFHDIAAVFIAVQSTVSAAPGFAAARLEAKAPSTATKAPD
jgi:hypothetical protein